MTYIQVSVKGIPTFPPKDVAKEAKWEQSNKSHILSLKSAWELPLFPQSLETSQAENTPVLFLMPSPADRKGKKNPVSKHLKGFLSTLRFRIAFRRDI